MKKTDVETTNGTEKRSKEPEHIEKFLSPNSDEWKLLDLPQSLKDNDGAKKQISNNKREIREILLTSLQMPNVVVLAGSGASLGDVKGPSMNDLWEKVTKNKLVYRYEKDDEETEVEIDPACISKTVKHDSNEKNIETLLTKCESYLQVEESVEVEEFLNEAKKVILSECSNFLKDGNLQGHRTFLHRLSKRRVRDPRLKIFTTNYDLCFERAAALQSLVVLDGFSFINPRRYDPNYFNIDIVRRVNKHDKTSHYLEGVFQLFKLHGSVNWERQGNEIVECNDPKPEKACLIYPAQGKYQQSYIQPHLELFSRYLSSLREPNTCLIISGFGFNDDHLAEPIISAIDTNPHLKVIIADYKAEEQVKGGGANKYWEKLKKRSLSGGDIWFINASFNEFAKRIPDLKALTSAQKLEQTIKSITS